MHITIATVSTAILDRLSRPGQLGIIHSVFDHAVNIKLDNPLQIIALTFQQAGKLPYALMVADGQLGSFITAGITTGQNVTLTVDRHLLIEGVDLLLDFSFASNWSPGMGSLADPPNIDAFIELIAWSASYIYDHANRAGLVPLLNNHRSLFSGNQVHSNASEMQIASLAAPVITSLLTALKYGNRVAAKKSITGLLGFGIGGTPSGDDLLVGMLAALRRSSRPLANKYQKLLNGMVNEQLTDESTSLLSSTILHHALGREFSEKIHDITRQLMHPEGPVALQTSLDRLLMHGATSGSEMFLGICLGFHLVYGINSHNHPGDQS
jgi:hypothetical protein